MRVVLAGGSGLIGRALCLALLELGHQPVVLSRDPQRARLSSGVRRVGWRPPAEGAWTAELDGADAVVNLAGASIGRWPWTAGRKRLLRESRLTATKSLVAALASLAPARRPAVLVNASGTDLYEGCDEVPATETTPPTDTFLARLCVDWEAEALRATALGIRVVLLRTSLVLAPGAPALSLMALPFRVFAGGPAGSGQQWISWIALQDAVALILKALSDATISGPLNLAAPNPTRQEEFARSLGAALHRPSWVRAPAWALRLALGEQATLALGSRRVWPAKALAAGFQFSHPRLDEAFDQVWASSR
jgi:uncharacterized protein (TIGR01777 family)